MLGKEEKEGTTEREPSVWPFRNILAVFVPLLFALTGPIYLPSLQDFTPRLRLLRSLSPHLAVIKHLRRYPISANHCGVHSRYHE